MSPVRVKNGKISPNISEKDCIVVLPDDDYTVIVIKPNRKVKEELPRCKKVYKPAKEDTTTIYGRMAESELLGNISDSDSDDGADGFNIGK